METQPAELKVEEYIKSEYSGAGITVLGAGVGKNFIRVQLPSRLSWPSFTDFDSDLSEKFGASIELDSPGEVIALVRIDPKVTESVNIDEYIAKKPSQLVDIVKSTSTTTLVSVLLMIIIIYIRWTDIINEIEYRLAHSMTTQTT
jgi:hypothetical protein